jgi:hypothetical protein
MITNDFQNSPASTLKDGAYITPTGPDHLAGLHVPEIVQCDLEGRWNNVAIVELKPDAAIADIAQGAGVYAALPTGEQQCSARILQPLNLPSFSHYRLLPTGSIARTEPDAACCFVQGKH